MSLFGSESPIITSIYQISNEAIGQLKMLFSQDPPTIPAAAVQGLPTIVQGFVNPGGAIAAGSAFTVSHSGTGVYVVTYKSSFRSTPMTKVQLAADQMMLAPVITGEDNGAFTLKTYDSTATAANCAFQFESSETNF